MSTPPIRSLRVVGPVQGAPAGAGMSYQLEDTLSGQRVFINTGDLLLSSGSIVSVRAKPAAGGRYLLKTVAAGDPAAPRPPRPIETMGDKVIGALLDATK